MRSRDYSWLSQLTSSKLSVNLKKLTKGFNRGAFLGLPNVIGLHGSNSNSEMSLFTGIKGHSFYPLFYSVRVVTQCFCNVFPCQKGEKQVPHSSFNQIVHEGKKDSD